MDQPRHSPVPATSEVAEEADFSIIRYAQCWEDTDVLLDALAIRPGDACFSIGSGGDNSLAILSRDPGSVVAVDLSPAQIALIEFKTAAFRSLAYRETLEVVGLVESQRRLPLYARMRAALSPSARAFWDARPRVIERGVSAAGKFERYFALFRRYVLPLVHTRAEIDALFVPRNLEQRRVFYHTRWNNRRWRALFHLFFSRPVVGRLGRDPRFFRYVEGPVAARLLARTEHGLIDLDPSSNPYLRWIVYGRFAECVPYVWRKENFEAIRRNVDRLELKVVSVETFLGAAPPHSFDRYNMSDIFEYVSEAATEALFASIVRCARPGARVAYWNMMAARHGPARLAARLHALHDESRRLHQCALTFFYGAFEVDEVRQAP